ncbi:MAG TPA: TIGR03016 family PEP-CTERM system-associated outer membrane protein, partial [Burkholderiaceae bacterium]|nr:TIGR03016 family PEP-CTERM system-associated outer membrane protein [Burkholderiaceae bacterium]
MIVLGALYAGTAAAARWSLEPGIEARATWTDNVALEEFGREDVLVELTPTVRLLGVGRGLRISGTLGATAVGYVNGTRDDRLLPLVDVAANLEPIERVFSVEAGVVTRQSAEDVFAPRPDGAADLNTVTITQYRVAPVLRGRFGGAVEYELRSGNSWTDVSGATAQADSAYLGEHRLRVERAPRRFGWRVELVRSDTRFESQSPPLARTDSGRLTLSYGVSETLSFGLRGGYEKTNVVVSDNEQAIYGAAAHWRPTERTDFEASAERRFFGTGWQLRFRHRMPRLAWDIRSGRDVSSFPQAFLTLPPTDNVAALLDAAFTTRFPDEAERRRVVADLIARHGLPASLATETALFSQRVSLITSNSATVSLIGVRNSVALSIFSTRTEELPDSVFTLAPTVTGNLKQEGAALTISHQLTPLTALNVTASHTRTRGIGVDQGPDSEQDGVRIQVTRQLGARTT